VETGDGCWGEGHGRETAGMERWDGGDERDERRTLGEGGGCRWLGWMTRALGRRRGPRDGGDGGDRWERGRGRWEEGDRWERAGMGDEGAGGDGCAEIARDGRRFEGVNADN
jgi:hypothetical protein